nr:MAG TPA: minor tail protein [Caudoviricetes sp.]
MAQIKLTVNTDLQQAKAAVDTLKKSFADLAKQLSTITVNKDLTAQLNALTKYYQSLAKAGASVTRSMNGTSSSLQTLRKNYIGLLSQTKTLKQQYPQGTFDQVTKSIEGQRNRLNALIAAYQKNGKLTDKQLKSLRSLSEGYKKVSADVAQLRLEGERLSVTDPFSAKTGDTIARLEKRYSSLFNTIQNQSKYFKKGTFDGLSQDLQKDMASLQAISTEFKTTGALGDDAMRKLNGLNSSILQHEAALKKTQATSKNYHGTLRDIIQGFIKFQLSASIVMNSIQLIRSAFNSLNETLVETEKVVVSIQRVLDETVEGGEISDKLYDIAERLGQTFDNVQEIAQNFAKAGLSWQETLDATEAAVLALNVAELTAEESSEGLIAVMQQFNYEASELVNVIDVLNKAADKSAVDTQELLVALQKTGSYASAANLSLEETVGLISALSEATAASGQNIGNALKSLFSYTTRESSLDTFAALSDDMNEVVEQYRLGAASILDVWEQLSVEMQSLDAQQADALSQWTESSGLDAELEGELSEIYDSLTGVYDSAGVYRKNYFIALMNNFEEVKEVMGEISDAAGYTAEEQAKYMDTYEAKLNSLQSQWEHLANDEQGWLSIKKGLVDMASGILTAIDAIGGLRTVVAALATVFASLFGAKIIKGIANIGKGFKNILSPLKNFQRYSQLAAEAQEAQAIATDLQTVADQKNAAAQALKNSADASSTAIQAAETAAVAANTKATEANAVATQKAALASKAFGSALNTVLGIAGIAITVITAVVSGIQNANEKARQAAEERRQAALDNWTEISEESAELAQLSKQYEDLSAVQNKNAEEEETFKTTQEQIIELLGEKAKVLGLLTEGTEEYTNKVKELTKAELANAARDAKLAQDAALEADNLHTKLLYFSMTGLADKTNICDMIETFSSNIYKGNDKDIKEKISEFLKQAINEYNPNSITAGVDFFSSLQELLLQYIPEEEWGDVVNGYLESLSKAQDEVENRINTVAEAQSLLYLYQNGSPQTQADIDEIVNNIMEVSQVGENYRETIEGIVVAFTGYEKATDDATDSTEDLVKTISSLKEEELDELIEALRTVRDLEQDSLDIEEKKKSIIEAQNDLIEAQQALEDAKNARGVYRLNAATGQFEWVQDEKAIADAEQEVQSAEENLQEAIDSLNEYIEDQAWDSVVEELESGNATNESILAILTALAAESYGDETPDWFDTILNTIKDATGIDISSQGSYDNGGVARGIGYLPKATSHPESVNNPELTAKILSPTSNAQFDRYVRDMGIMFEQARAYTQAPVLQSTAGNNVVTTTNNSTYINGVKIGSDMMSKPFGEVLQMVSMVPTK